MHNLKGAIIGHVGPMFGGKTSALLTDVRKMRIAGYKVALFKPAMDNRYAEEKVVNHNGESIKAININSFDDIVDYVFENEDVQVIAIDEIQFLKVNKVSLTSFIFRMIEDEKTVIFAGLDLDSEMDPFYNVKELMPYCTHLEKHRAVCVKCGAEATTSYCTIEKSTTELIGGKDIYEPRCLRCYFSI